MLNVYELVTQRILEQLEQGVIPWRKPWRGSKPINYMTRKAYRGINTLLLPHGGEYLSFKQCKDLGGKVKKGEKGHMIVFYKMIENVDLETDEVSTIPFLKYSTVFHISQCESVTSKIEPLQHNKPIGIITQAQNIIDDYITHSGVALNHVEDSNRAYYTPANDSITLPEIAQFEGSEEYYSTVYHEMAHSTGHQSRLNRISKVAAFGTKTYSKEELTAEISSAMLMNHAGIEQPGTFANSVAYIQGWKSKLKGDSRAIITAASQAQKATDLILGL